VTRPNTIDLGPAPTRPPEVNTSQGKTGTEESKTKKPKNKMLVYGISAGVLIIIIAVLCGFYYVCGATNEKGSVEEGVLLAAENSYRKME